MSYGVQKFFVRLWCKLTRRRVPSNYENWDEYVERHRRMTNTPEYRERIRNLPPAFIYSRSTGELRRPTVEDYKRRARLLKGLPEEPEDGKL